MGGLELVVCVERVAARFAQLRANTFASLFSSEPSQRVLLGAHSAEEFIMSTMSLGEMALRMPFLDHAGERSERISAL